MVDGRRTVDVRLLHHSELAREVRGVHERAHLEVEIEAAAIDVGRGDHGEPPVDGDRLGVEQPVLELVDGDARLQELRVVAAARRRHQRRVVAGGNDQRHGDAAQRRGAQGGQGGLVRHEVRRGQYQLFARRVERHLDHLQHRLVTAGGAGADDLDGVTAWSLPRTDGEQVGEYLVGVEVPVLGEEHLQVAHRRALDSNHDVNPRRILRLDGECGVGDVLASGVADHAVEDGDLAVVAEIDSRQQHPEEVRRQRCHDPDAAGDQSTAQIGSQKAL